MLSLLLQCAHLIVVSIHDGVQGMNQEYRQDSMDSLTGKQLERFYDRILSLTTLTTLEGITISSKQQSQSILISRVSEESFQ